jgi:hypothetical protein
LLEYRLKRVLHFFGKTVSRSDSLEGVIGGIWGRLRSEDRLDGQGKCTQPAEWRVLARQLRELAKWRDCIAHGSYRELVTRKNNQSLENTAALLYRKVVEAIQLLNVHTGKDARPEAVVEAYFAPTLRRPRRSRRPHKGLASRRTSG